MVQESKREYLEKIKGRYGAAHCLCNDFGNSGAGVPGEMLQLHA